MACCTQSVKDSKKVFEPARNERVSFHVEIQIVLVDKRQPIESLFGLNGQEFVFIFAGVLLVSLQLSLCAKPLNDSRLHPGNACISTGARKSIDCRNPGCTQCGNLTCSNVRN